MAIANEPFDIVLSDQRMARVTGVDVLEAAMRTNPAVIRILMTGDSSLPLVQEALARGRIHGYIEKTADAAHVARTLGTVLGVR